MKKEFWKSKAVIGGLLVAVGGVFSVVGSYINGDVVLIDMATRIIAFIGAGLSVIGIRVRLS